MDTLPDGRIRSRALVVERPGAPFVLQDVILDTLRANEILVRIEYAGICHTDLVVQAGSFSMGEYPAVLGHEGSGTILRMGDQVQDMRPELEVGDLVLLSFVSCMECTSCNTGRKGSCLRMTEINFGGARGTNKSPISLADGSFVRGQFFGQSSFGELAVVDARSAVRYTGKVEDLSVLAPIGCGYQTGAGTVFNVLKPKQDQTLAVFGLGAVGLTALMAAKSLNVGRIIAVDIADTKLNLSKTLGATDTINPTLKNVLEAIRAIIPQGVDFIIDTTGLSHMLNDGIRALAHKGTLALVGTPKPTEKIEIDALDLLVACKKIVGVVEGDCNPAMLIPYLISLFREGRFPIDRISKVYTLDRMDEAINDLRIGKVVKPILKWN